MTSKIITFFLIITSLSFAQTKSPKIYSQKGTFNFGDIQEGKLFKHNFTIANKGDKELKISKVRASCGCTAVKPAKNILQPGDSTNIMVTFNSAHRSGLQRKHVYVYSNDPENPQVRLSFTANVVNEKIKKRLANGPEIYLQSNQYNFGTVQSGTVVTGKLRIKNSGKGKLLIDRVETSAKYLTAEVNKNMIASGSVGEISIRFNSEKRIGKLTRTVTIYSNDPRNPREIITVFINIVAKEK